MTNTDDVWGEPEVPRDRWSRPLIVPPKGGKPVAYTRCTTFAGSVEDTYNLSQWQQRMVALGLAERPDLMVSVAAHYDDKTELNKICQTAIEAAKGKAAAGVGTALHKLTDRLDRGEPLGPVPAEYQPDLDAFAVATKVMKPLALERFVVQDDMKIGGTFDRLYEFEGRRYIGDTKSGSIEWGSGKIAMQLAIYSRSVLYDVKTKGRTPLDVDQDRAIVVHLPAGQGRCELKWVDIRAGWTAVQLAAHVRTWRSRKGLIVDFGAYRVPAVPAVPAPVVVDDVVTQFDAVAQSFASPALDYKVGDKVTVGGIEFTKIGDDPFNTPKHAGADGACPDYGSNLDPCPPGCASGTCVANKSTTEAAVTTITEAFGTVAELTLIEQIVTADSAERLEALWSDNRDRWHDGHTAAAKKRKQQLHQLVLKNAVSAA